MKPIRLFSSFILILQLLSCATTRSKNDVSSKDYTIETLNIKKNGFAGNIVVEVYDMNQNPLNDYQSILVANGKVIFDVPQKQSTCTFFEDGKKITIEIRKERYKNIKTAPFSTDKELESAQVIKIYLSEE